MAAATWAMRASGFWMMAHIPLTPRLRRMLEALPGCVVAATVLPIVAKSGVPALVAVSIALAVMAARRNEFLAVACGLVAASLVRVAGF